MFEIVLITVFCVGYLMIAFEHPLKIDKTASALLTGVVLWGMLVFKPFFGAQTGHTDVNHELALHFEETAQILVFLLAAMTIVELIDSHNGFGIINKLVKTVNKVKLLWILSVTTFFTSAVLDNLTTTIVMITLLRKIIADKNDLWFFAGFIVIAANAGGAWSPIGDVTTIMLWNGGQVSTFNIIKEAFLPSMLCLLMPLLIASFMLKGKNFERVVADESSTGRTSAAESRFLLVLGVCLLLLVPVFKAITHLPPYMGMLFSLAILWIATEIMHQGKPDEVKKMYSVATVIRRIDTPSVLFFLGILLAVAALQTNGQLKQLGLFLDENVANYHVVNLFLGFLSAIIDNVPLVAGAMGMYDMVQFPQDHHFWNMLAYCAGTGGSSLIIGSAAGVAAMGILKIDFIWYLKKISWLSVIGYVAGAMLFFMFE